MRARMGAFCSGRLRQLFEFGPDGDAGFLLCAGLKGPRRGRTHRPPSSRCLFHLLELAAFAIGLTGSARRAIRTYKDAERAEGRREKASALLFLSEFSAASAFNLKGSSDPCAAKI